MSNRVAIEALESRTLLSATPSATAKLDRLQIRVDLLKFRADAFAGSAAILSDRLSMKADNVAAATTVTPLLTQLKNDAKAMRTALKVDRLTEAANALTDEATIATDLKQIILDKGNATALVTDQAKLKADRVQLQNDLIAGLDSRIATRQSYHDTLFNDTQAILAAANTDPNASAKLKTDVQTFVTDVDAKLDKMAADLTQIANDRAKLVADLSA
jgi:hypothetical protein